MHFFSLFILIFALLSGPFAVAGVSVQKKRQALFVSYGTYGSTEHRNLFQTLEINGYELSILSPNFPDRVTAVNPSGEIFFRSVADYTNKAKHPELETLLIFIDLHGESQRDGERTHPVLFGEERFSLDRIDPILRELTDRGVDVGLISFSCYAGRAILLAEGNDKVCVVTSSDAHSPSLPWVMNVYAHSFNSGGSLSEIYRRVRLNYLFPTFPQISTPSGLTLADQALEFARVIRTPGSSRELKSQWLSVIEGIASKERELAEKGLDVQSSLQTGSFAVVPDSAKYFQFVTAERSYYERRYSELEATSGLVPSSACDRIRFPMNLPIR